MLILSFVLGMFLIKRKRDESWWGIKKCHLRWKWINGWISRYLWEREGIEHLYNAKKYLNFWKTA